MNTIVGAVLFTLLFLTANTMMQSVRERTSELAVLKTLGFSDGKVLALVLIEACCCVFAALAGLRPGERRVQVAGAARRCSATFTMPMIVLAMGVGMAIAARDW